MSMSVIPMSMSSNPNVTPTLEIGTAAIRTREWIGNYGYPSTFGAFDLLHTLSFSLSLDLTLRTTFSSSILYVCRFHLCISLFIALPRHVYPISSSSSTHPRVWVSLGVCTLTADHESRLCGSHPAGGHSWPAGHAPKRSPIPFPPSPSSTSGLADVKLLTRARWALHLWHAGRESQRGWGGWKCGCSYRYVWVEGASPRSNNTKTSEPTVPCVLQQRPSGLAYMYCFATVLILACPSHTMVRLESPRHIPAALPCMVTTLAAVGTQGPRHFI